MYFNGKTYFNQDTNLRVVADQRNPPPRRKGVKKKKTTKKKDGKVDMKKLKSLFGSDIIVKLLLSLVDKQSRGPNLKSEGRKQLGEGKVKKMRKAKGANFQTPGALKKERAVADKKRRVDEASILKPGETQEDVLNRLIKEVAVDGDPASLAFLKANTIPPELKKLIGKMSVYGEAFLDKDITPAKKKALERTIIKEVIEGVGGDVRKEFIKTATDDEDIVEGFKEGVEALKKQGYTNAETIIQKKDEIEKKLIKKREKAKTSKEVDEVEKALTGLEVIQYTGTTNTGNMEQNITEEIIDKIESKRGRQAQTPEKRKKLLLEYAISLNADLEQPGENKDFFSLFIEDGLDGGATNAQIKSKMKTQIGNLSKNKELKKFGDGKKEQTGPAKATRADADIFSKGAVANLPNSFNITKPDGTTRRYDGEVINPKMKYLVRQIRLYEDGTGGQLGGDIGTKKEYASFKRQLKEEQRIFRELLKRISEGQLFKPEPGYSSVGIDGNRDIDELAQDLYNQGYYFAKPGQQYDIKIDEDEKIVGIGQQGITIEGVDGFIRYLDFDQSDFKPQYDALKKKDATEKKLKRKLGIKVSEQDTDLQALIDKQDNSDRYRQGLLTDVEIEKLPPRLIADYPAVKKEADKQRAAEKKIADKAAKTALSTGIGQGQLRVNRFKKGQEGAIFNKETGAPITQEEVAADPFKLFDAFDVDGGNTIDEEEAEKLQDTQLRTRYLEDLTEQEIAEIQAQPQMVDDFGNVIDPFSTFPSRPQTEAQLADAKADKQNTQAELIERYKVDKSVLKDIKLPGRKKLTQQGLYTLTADELAGMKIKERKKYEAVIANRAAIQEGVYGEGGKEEADRLLLLRNQGKDLTDDELKKISYADRKAQGLLTNQEVSDITDKKDRKSYLEKKNRIDEQIEAFKVRERKEIVDDFVLEGTNFDRVKEQADYFGQSRADIVREDRFDAGFPAEPQSEGLEGFAFRDTPPSTPPPRQGGGGIGNSINEQGNQQKSLDAAGPKKANLPGRKKKKPENIGDALNAALGGGVSEAEKKRKKEAMKKLDEQQKALALEIKRQELIDAGINPDAKSTEEELPLLDFTIGARRRGSDSEEDYTDVFNQGGFGDSDDDGGGGEYLLEGDNF